MSRSELATTIVGLAATFLVPWPQTDEPRERQQVAPVRAIAANESAMNRYRAFGRVRTGPTLGIQPTR